MEDLSIVLRLIFGICFMILLVSRIFCWYIFYDHRIKGQFLVGELFYCIPTWSLNIDDITYVERHSWNSSSKIFKQYMGTRNRFRRYCLIIETKRGFVFPLMIVPDNADEFVANLRKVKPGIGYYVYE